MPPLPTLLLLQKCRVQLWDLRMNGNDDIESIIIAVIYSLLIMSWALNLGLYIILIIKATKGNRYYSHFLF